MQPRSKRVAALLSVLQRSHASALLPGAPTRRPWTDGRHEFDAEDNSHGVLLRREVHRVTSPDGPLLAADGGQRGGISGGLGRRPCVFQMIPSNQLAVVPVHDEAADNPTQPLVQKLLRWPGRY